MKVEDPPVTSIVELKSAIRKRRKWLRDIRHYPAPSSKGLTRKERKLYGNKPVPLDSWIEAASLWELNEFRIKLRAARNLR
jgi:hypothetical protein